MSSLNKSMIIGNLGQDPKVNRTGAGTTVANISVATTETWKDKTTGQKQERTEWHNVVFFGKLGEIVESYLRKGSKVYVEGSMRTRKWQDQSGNDRYTTEIVASEMKMLDGRRAGDSATAPAGDDYGSYPEAAGYGDAPAMPPADEAQYAQ